MRLKNELLNEQTLNITGERFKYLDCSKGNIFFDTFAEEPFKVKVCGVILSHQLGIDKRDIYLPARIVFEDAIYVFIQYRIYTHETTSGFVKNWTGDGTTMQLALGKKENLNDYTKYVIEGDLARYAGYGQLTIYCRGEIKLMYDENKVVDVSKIKKYRLRKSWHKDFPISKRGTVYYSSQ